MIKINLISEAPAAAAPRKKRPEFSLGAKQGDIILMVVLAVSAIVVGTQWYLLTSKRAELKEATLQRLEEGKIEVISGVNLPIMIKAASAILTDSAG